VHTVNLVAQSESPVKILDGGVVKGVPLSDTGHIKVLVGGVVKAFGFPPEFSEFFFLNRSDYTNNQFTVLGKDLLGNYLIGEYDIATSTWLNLYSTTISQPFFVIGNYIYFYDNTIYTLEKRSFDSSFTFITSTTVTPEILTWPIQFLAENGTYFYTAEQLYVSINERYTLLKKYNMDLSLLTRTPDPSFLGNPGAISAGNIIAFYIKDTPPAPSYLVTYDLSFNFLNKFTGGMYYYHGGGQMHTTSGLSFLHYGGNVFNTATGNLSGTLTDYYTGYSASILSFSATQDYFSYISADKTKIYIYDTSFALQHTINC
jgi:hypothetical protein